jgi:predicted metal-dependent peptidase
MSQQETLSKTSKDLMLKEPYYGHFLIMLNKYWSTRVPTAGVSKMNINYQLEINADFWAKLTDNHRLGLLKHELLHIAFGHLSTIFKFSDRKLANIAMDMEINQYIERGWLPGDEYTKEEYDTLVESLKERITAGREDGTLTEEQIAELAEQIPNRGIMIEDYPELNLDTKAGSRYYYDKLQEAKENKEQNGTCGSPGMDKLLDQLESGEGIPDHSTWEDFENMSEAEQKLIGKQLQKLLSDAKEQTVKKRGTVPGEIEGLIEIDEILPPKFDWRGYIRRFTGVSTRVFSKKIRRKENRKFPDSPGLKLKMKQHMLLAIDTSGSVSDKELAEFMNEMHHIYKAGVDITVIQCDTRIHSIEPYKGELDLKIHGRGGTEFDPVIEYFNQNNKLYTSLVYFTDGECSVDVLPKGPTLWVLSEQSYMNENLPGRVIKLEL